MQQKMAFDIFCYKQIVLSFFLFSVPRYIFLFDKVVIVCKRKGYNYELKEIIELHFYKMSDDPMNNRDMKKVRGLWSASRRACFRINKPDYIAAFKLIQSMIFMYCVLTVQRQMGQSDRLLGE